MAAQHALSDVCLDFGTLVPATLLERVNPFHTRILVGDRESSAYLADRGRLEEVVVPGRRVWVRAAPAGARKTAYDFVLIEHAGTLVSLNTHLPNKLLRLALDQQALPWFAGTTTVQSEVRLGESRLDFRLTDAHGDVCWLEAKSAALVKAGVARFPDAPTRRGRRHLGELIRAAEQGERAAVVFVVPRGDATALAPYDERDPAFGAALRAAAAACVEIRALRCTVTTARICLERAIPVYLDSPTP